MGSAGNNYYARSTDDNLTFKLTIPAVTCYALSGWESYSGLDANSKKSPKTITDVNDLKFEYNATSFNKTISLDANYIDVTGKSYPGTIILAAYSSVVLIRNGAITNQPTKANAGPDQSIILPSNTIYRSGRGTDPDGTISSYSWTKISGPSAGTITNASNASTSVSGLIQGVYKFELVVTDNNGATGSDTMQLTVNAAPNIAPVANAGIDQTITLPTSSATLTGSGTDADGTIVGYSWKQISGPSASRLVSPNSAGTISDNLVAGTYEFELTVSDNMGAVGKDTIVIVVAVPRLNLLNPDILSNSMKIYPNPVVDKATLEINLTQAKSKVMVVITNMLGNIVYQKNLPAGADQH